MLDVMRLPLYDKVPAAAYTVAAADEGEEEEDNGDEQ